MLLRFPALGKNKCGRTYAMIRLHTRISSVSLYRKILVRSDIIKVSRVYTTSYMHISNHNTSQKKIKNCLLNDMFLSNYLVRYNSQISYILTIVVLDHHLDIFY